MDPQGVAVAQKLGVLLMGVLVIRPLLGPLIFGKLS